MASYLENLESYAAHFELPIRHGVRVERLRRANGRYELHAGGPRFEADHVIVAAGGTPWSPPFADDLHAGVQQMHSIDYRRPAQLRDGPVLVVGTGNTGAEIALELAATHRVLLSGRDVGQLAGRFPARAPLRSMAVGVWALLHGPTVETRAGRLLRARMSRGGTPRIRVKRATLTAAGVEWVPRVVDVVEGRPLLADGRLLDVHNVVWATGYRWLHPWIERAAGDAENGAAGAPGLHFLGAPFLRTALSLFVAGVGHDAAHVVRGFDRR